MKPLFSLWLSRCGDSNFKSVFNLAILLPFLRHDRTMTLLSVYHNDGKTEGGPKSRHAGGRMEGGWALFSQSWTPKHQKFKSKCKNNSKSPQKTPKQTKIKTIPPGNRRQGRKHRIARGRHHTNNDWTNSAVRTKNTYTDTNNKMKNKWGERGGKRTGEWSCRWEESGWWAERWQIELDQHATRREGKARREEHKRHWKDTRRHGIKTLDTTRRRRLPNHDTVIVSR